MISCKPEGEKVPSTRLISADSHVAVSLDAIRGRVPESLHAAFDDAIAEQARRDEELRGGRSLSFDLEAMRDPGYHDPVARLAAMDRDGVEAEVLYSEVSAFRAYGLVKGDWKPISRAFTDHLSEFAGHDPKRLVVSYQVPILDIPYAVQEVQRLAALGARSVHLPNFPSELGLPDYHDPVYDPLWGALQETGISISHHLGNRVWLYDVLRRDPTPQAGIFTSMPSLALCEVVAWWIMTGTLERFPGLKIVFVEPHLYWIPGFLGQLDLKASRGRYEFPGLKMKPSEYFRRNIWLSFEDDRAGVLTTPLFGEDNFMWGSDFPHVLIKAGYGPSLRHFERFSYLSAADRDRILSKNAERLYWA